MGPIKQAKFQPQSWPMEHAYLRDGRKEILDGHVGNDNLLLLHRLSKRGVGGNGGHGGVERDEGERGHGGQRKKLSTRKESWEEICVDFMGFSLWGRTRERLHVGFCPSACLHRVPLPDNSTNKSDHSNCVNVFQIPIADAMPSRRAPNIANRRRTAGKHERQHAIQSSISMHCLHAFSWFSLGDPAL
jgi:hypothetical protein